MATLTITDRVTLTAAQAAAWEDLWRTQYLPAAQQRSMTLVADSPRYEYTPTGNTILTIIYTLPDAESFWAMRLAAGTDPSVTDFWQQTDAMAHGRERHIGMSENSVPALSSDLPQFHRWFAMGTFANPTDPQTDTFIAEARALATLDPNVALSTAGKLHHFSASTSQWNWDLSVSADPTTIPSITNLLNTYSSVVQVTDMMRLLPIQWNTRRTGQVPTLKRTLLLNGGTGAEEVVTMLESMPNHIRSFEIWSLSEIDPSTSTSYTHCWEQEYPSEAAYLEYLNSPYHISSVDPYFDMENPLHAVAPTFQHMLYQTPCRGVIAPPSTL